MVKTFSGAQYLKILFKIGNTYKLTKSIQIEQSLLQTFHNVAKLYQLQILDPQLITYQMVRKQEKCQLLTFTVVFAQVKQDQKLEKLEWSTDEKQIQEYKKQIKVDLPTLQIFAQQGSKIQLIK